MLRHMAKIEGMRSRNGLLGAVAAAALTVGIFATSSIAAPAVTSDVVAATSLSEGTRFVMMNYQTKGCFGYDPFSHSLVAKKYMCDESHSARWMQGSGNSIRHTRTEKTAGDGTHFCLDANASGQVYVLACNGGNYQKWTHYSEGFVKNWATGQCLDVTSDTDVVYTRECLKHEWQKWADK